ncbi:MAG: hypothetical protein FJ387_30315 [Verrucomicrobia bacterium]|nr:hypothetical protein [Verrucomicrobiota bacterium]
MLDIREWPGGDEVSGEDFHDLALKDLERFLDEGVVLEFVGVEFDRFGFGGLGLGRTRGYGWALFGGSGAWGGRFWCG